jgi:CRISPR type IV-associated protein Csf1
MLQHKPFRTRSWIATTNGVEYIESGDGRLKLREALLDPPKPPFAIYVTRNHQRQGWLTLMRRVSLSRDRFYVGNDLLDSPAYIVRDRFVQLLGEAEAMLARKVPRSVLLREAEPTVQLVKRALQEGWMEQLQRAMERAGDPAWEVAVYVGRAE